MTTRFVDCPIIYFYTLLNERRLSPPTPSENQDQDRHPRGRR